MMNAEEIIQRLCECGYEAYLSGGAPRDLMLGETPSDEDVVTNAVPADIQVLFNRCKVSLVGVAFKVCIVDQVEVATYRTDKYLGMSAKNCKVEVADTIQEDLARRDLSINSMAFCPYTGELIDEFGGRSDLENKIIRFTGNAEDRILEDPCRILRACRFLAKIEGTFAESTKRALRKHAGLVKKTVAPERIQKELVKVMVYNKPSLFFEACDEIGILQDILPSLHTCIGFDGGKYHKETVFEHNMMVGDALSSKDPLLRLTGYLHDIAKPIIATIAEEGHVTFINHEHAGADLIRAELKALKFSSKDIEFIANLTRYHMRSFSKDVTPKATKRLLKCFHDDGVNYRDWIRLKIADCKGNLGKDDYSFGIIRKMAERIQLVLNPKEGDCVFGINDLAVNGKDVMKALNISPGPKVGEILQQLLETVLDNPNYNDKETLIKLIKNMESRAG